MRLTITIDGPAGAGKSTVGAAVARRLGYRFIDSGVLYRAVTLAAIRQGIAPSDGPGLTAIAATLALEFAPSLVADGRLMTVLLNGEDVTWALRSAPVNDAVSEVSAHAAVRQALLERQRALGQAGGVIMVGRDIGTTVLPKADLKIYLEASVEERARRRHQEQLARGEPSDEVAVLAALRRRDAIDSQRAASPLRPAADAVIVVSDDLTIEAVAARIIDLVQVRLAPVGRRGERDQSAAP